MLQFLLLNYPDGSLSFTVGCVRLDIDRDPASIDPGFLSVYNNLTTKAKQIHQHATNESLNPVSFKGVISGWVAIKNPLDELTEAAIDIRLCLLA